MGGIAGIVNFDGRSVDSNQVALIVDSLSHRGPDGLEYFHDEGITLIQFDFFATPEESNNRGLCRDNDAKKVIISDARLDNRKDVLRRLDINWKNGEKSDSFIILKSYEKWGGVCPQHLIGDFAFVIWDQQLRQLFCVRDHIGSKPLYYYYTAKSFVFSSELNGLLSLPAIRQTLNEERLEQYLRLRTTSNTDTFYKDILRLAPASSLIVKRCSVSVQQYWDIRNSGEIKRKDNDSYAEEFRDVFFEAVRCRIGSASVIAGTLSGGLDSSAVACTARRIMGDENKIHLYSYNFPQLDAKHLPLQDERLFQEAVLAQGDFVHHEILGHEYSPLVDLPEYLKIYGQPFFYPHLYLERQTWAGAKRDGAKVFLNGLFGDSVISFGYDYLNDLVLNGNIYKIIRTVNELSARNNVAKKRLYRYYFLAPYFKHPILAAIRALTTISSKGDLFRKRKLGEGAFPFDCTDNSDRELRFPQRAKAAHARELKHPFIAESLEMVNIFSSKSRLDVRCPFVDRRLMEFCYGIPEKQKIQQGWTRFILRQGMREVLPSKVLERIDKSNLSYGFLQNLSMHCLTSVENALARPSSTLRKYIKTERYLEQLRSFKKEPYSCSSKNHINLYVSFILSGWCPDSDWRHVEVE